MTASAPRIAPAHAVALGRVAGAMLALRESLQR